MSPVSSRILKVVIFFRSVEVQNSVYLFFGLYNSPLIFALYYLTVVSKGKIHHHEYNEQLRLLNPHILP